jgi:hypothetical protein
LGKLPEKLLEKRLGNLQKMGYKKDNNHKMGKMDSNMGKKARQLELHTESHTEVDKVLDKEEDNTV